MKTENKKGISPLIATVILIGFVVAIAAIVMLWGKGFVTETAEKEGELAKAKMACQRVKVKIYEGIGGAGLMIENTGSETISGFIIRSKGIGYKTKPNFSLRSFDPIDSSTLLGSIEAGGPNTLSSGDEIIPAIRPAGIGAPLMPCSNVAKTII